MTFHIQFLFILCLILPLTFSLILCLTLSVFIVCFIKISMPIFPYFESFDYLQDNQLSKYNQTCLNFKN